MTFMVPMAEPACRKTGSFLPQTKDSLFSFGTMIIQADLSLHVDTDQTDHTAGYPLIAPVGKKQVAVAY